MFQEVSQLSGAKSCWKMCLGKVPSTGVAGSCLLQGGCGNVGISQGAQLPAAKHELPLVVILFNQLGLLDKLSQEKY